MTAACQSFLSAISRKGSSCVQRKDKFRNCISSINTIDLSAEIEGMNFTEMGRPG